MVAAKLVLDEVTRIGFMNSLRIIAQSLNGRDGAPQPGRFAAYNPRNCHHIRITCWTTVLDLMQSSDLVRREANKGALGFATNVRARDSRLGIVKVIPLVVATGKPRVHHGRVRNFLDLARLWQVELTQDDLAILETQPPFLEITPDSILVALTCSASMSRGASSRLFDSMNGYRRVIRCCAPNAVAASIFLLAGKTLSLNRSGSTPSPFPKSLEIPRQFASQEGDDYLPFDAVGAAMIYRRPSENNRIRVESVPSLDLGYDTMLTKMVAALEKRLINSPRPRLC